jgi:hypothetical protein
LICEKDMSICPSVKRLTRREHEAIEHDNHARGISTLASREGLLVMK